MRKVVVNTTPLIALAEIGRLEILKDLYGKIIIPQAVFDEIKYEPAYTEVRQSLDWIDVVQIKDETQKKMFQSRLHAGELEAIIYADEIKADLIILDDKLARKTANYLKLNVTGTLGVISKAKEIGIVKEVKPIIDSIIDNGLYISPSVVELVLRSAGELD